MSSFVSQRPPRDRLPLLYLIDSITKNLAGPFIRLFVPRLHRLVLETFDSCPPGSDVSKAVVRMVDSWLQVDVFPMDFVNDLRAKLREPLPSPSTMPPVHPRPVVPPAAVPPPKRLRPMEPNWPALEADVRQFPQLTPLYRRLQAVWNARGDITPDLHRLSDAIGQLRMQAMPGPPPVAHHHHHLAGASLEPPLHDRDVSLDYLIVDTIDKLAGIVAPQQPETRAPPAAVPVFTTDSLRVRDQSVVDALYSAIPLQCAYCGLRIRAKADMATHLDWHFATNKEATKRGKTTSSQLWFMSLAEWVACSGADEREAPASYFDDLQRAKEASEQSEPEPVCTASSYVTHPQADMPPARCLPSKPTITGQPVPSVATSLRRCSTTLRRPGCSSMPSRSCVSSRAMTQKTQTRPRTSCISRVAMKAPRQRLHSKLSAFPTRNSMARATAVLESLGEQGHVRQYGCWREGVERAGSIRGGRRWLAEAHRLDRGPASGGTAQ